MPLPIVTKYIFAGTANDLWLIQGYYDLHVHPFVSVAEHERLLAIVPHFPMDSNPEENNYQKTLRVQLATFRGA